MSALNTPKIDQPPEDPSLGRSSGPQVLTTRTFLLTVSTKDPVTEECQNAIVRSSRESCVYSYIVTETGKSGKLHLHALLIYETHRDKKKLQENITNRLVRKHGHPEAKNGLAVLVQVAPGPRWYHEYLRKESGVRVLYDNYDPEKALKYYPDKATQEFLQTHTRISGPADQHIAEHERRWIEHSEDPSYESAIHYLRHRMHVLRDMIVIQDSRRLCQLALALHHHRTKFTGITSEERRYGSLHDCAAHDYTLPPRPVITGPPNAITADNYADPSWVYK